MATSIHAPSYLHLEPRPVFSCFEDDDGPGHLSRKGPRHDNDHVHIKDIQILPTTDEILAVSRPPYMPKKNLSKPHHLGHGPPRHLDVMFRHLRYESTERLRDCCYNAAQDMAWKCSTQVDDDEVRKETTSGTRYFVYHRVKIENIFGHERNGLMAQLSYDCPAFMRRNKMKTSGRLEQGMLCALISLGTDSTLRVVFLEIQLRQSTFAMDSAGGDGLRAAIEVSIANKDKPQDILHIIRHVREQDNLSLALIEFPGVLYAGFQWHLKKLQELQGHDIAFLATIAPQPASRSKLPSDCGSVPLAQRRTQRPAYTAHEHYEVDLKPIVERDVKLPIEAFDSCSREGTLQLLKDCSSLDDSQAVALCDTLTREIAFTQGPPGTGKTYLGIAIARTILASRKPFHVKPILVVCLTNHALDNFLKGLVDAGVDRITRLGHGSREEWTKKYGLKSLSSKVKAEEKDRAEKKAADMKRRDIFNKINVIASAIIEQKETKIPSWFLVKDYLQEHSPVVYEQLVTEIDSFQAQAFTFQYWAGGGDLKNLEELHKELRNILYPNSSEAASKDDLDAALAKIQRHAEESSSVSLTNVWRLSLSQRRVCLKEWAESIDEDRVLFQLVDLQLELNQANDQLTQARQAIDARCLADRDIIGMTTTVCARNWSLLKRLDIEVVMCEEAGEVMEPHTLCSLFQTVEHAIFIGDPLQLRPQVEERLLKTEMNDNPEYRLDESLFEKFMIPRDLELTPIPFSQLEIQRRMHPEISAITRLTYPYLIDHSETASHPATDGFLNRMFWFDHNYPENSPESSATKSYSNDFEANMIFGLIKYLLRGGAYALGEIAVLTPYSGQLALLKKIFQGTCPVWLNPRDRQMLINDGILEESSYQVREDLAPIDLLRLATVDNFQGEEARVIILSTVRTSTPGFLRTENRVNVMCSRARDGFYIFGSAQTFREVPRWHKILDIFDGQGCLGSVLMTCCSRHSKNLQKITCPGDFDSIPACPEPCLQERPCGHTCAAPCHAAAHDTIPCQKPCLKSHNECGHKCTKMCGEECGKCSKVIDRYLLGCGHEVNVTCPDTIEECIQIVGEVHAMCGHIIKILCSKVNDPLVCNERCGTVLPCGHLCVGMCAECNPPDRHPPCSEACGKTLECGHTCTAVCHEGPFECPPCSRPCEKSCQHGTCKKSCSADCDPCVLPHKRACKHEIGGLTLCSLPNPEIPCSLKCSKMMSCGHYCPSLCGEPCPPQEMCPQCERGLTDETSEEVYMYLQPCGDLLDIKDLDARLLNKIYKISIMGTIEGFKRDPELDDLRCPVCDHDILGNRRYAIVHELFHFNDNVDRLIHEIGTKLNVCAGKIYYARKQLEDKFNELRLSIRPNPLAGRSNKRLILERSQKLNEVQRHITNFHEDVVLPFETSMMRLQPLFPAYVVGSNFPFALRSRILLARLRLEWILDNLRVADYLASLSDPSEELPRIAALLRRHSSNLCVGCKDMCTQGVDLARAKVLPAIAAEFLILLIFFAYYEARCEDSSERKFSPSATSSSGPFKPTVEMAENIKAAEDLCKHYPRTAGKLLQSLTELPRFFAQSALQIPPTIPTRQTRETEQRLGEHQLRCLTECDNGHPYSTATFEDGCPECEEAVLDIEQQVKKNNEFLREDEFLAHMRRQIEQ